VKKWEKKQQMVTDKVVRVEELQRKNILIFGLEDTTEAVAKFFKDTEDRNSVRKY
jgi:hypothetical protein